MGGGRGLVLKWISVPVPIPIPVGVSREGVPRLLVRPLLRLLRAARAVGTQGSQSEVRGGWARRLSVMASSETEWTSQRGRREERCK